MVEWQTRTFEGRMPKGMRVQVPPRARLCWRLCPVAGLFIQSRDSARLYQLWVKAAVSVIGPPIVIELGLAVPEKEPVPVPVQPLKL